MVTSKDGYPKKGRHNSYLIAGDKEKRTFKA
jgi:hypothetical protein